MRSSTDSDIRLLRELMNFQPDLIIAYEGRNESMNLPLYSGINAILIRIHIQLLRSFPLYRLMNYFYDDNFNGGERLEGFAHMTSGKGPVLLKTHYMKNLQIINNICRNKGCHIVFLSQLKSKYELNPDSEIAIIDSYLEEFASKNNCFLFKIDKAYASSEFFKSDFIMDNTNHPGFMGYMFIAKDICKSLYDNDIIAAKNVWNWSNLQNDRYYLNNIGFNSSILNKVYAERVISFFRVNNIREKCLQSVADYKATYGE